MTRTIYLDHNATTPLHPKALDAMMPYLTSDYGNPASSTHDWGLRARKAVEEARRELAELIHARPDQIIFTSGATEANNLAIKGVARAHSQTGKHLVTTAIEHPSVSMAIQAMEKDGFKKTVVFPGADGAVKAADVLEAIGDETVLVSVLTANGEIGVCQPVQEIAAGCRERGVLFHTDATQGVGKIPIDVRNLGIDFLSLSAHKMYGPKGVGALFCRRDIELEPLFSGGGQERGIRSGTLNVPGIVGLGAAARIRKECLEEECKTVSALCETLWEGIKKRVPDAVLNGDCKSRIPGTLNVAFPRVDSERLMLALDGFALSASSACNSGKGDPSPVLSAIGLDPEMASCSVRFGLGSATTSEDIQQLMIGIERAIRRIRGTAINASPIPLS